MVAQARLRIQKNDQESNLRSSNLNVQQKEEEQVYKGNSALSMQVSNDTTDRGPSRSDWVRMMRRKFSPQEMLLPDGEINQDFFKPTKVS